MDETRLGEDRPRNLSYADGKFHVSIIYSWADPGCVPSGVKVRVEEIARPNVCAFTPHPAEKIWNSLEGAEAEGRRIASGLMDKWEERNP